MKSVLILATLLGVLAFSSATTFGFGGKIECLRNLRLYESRIKELIEGLRDQLKDGVPEKNIPPMDPLVMNNFNVQLDNNLAQLEGTLTGKVTGLMGFEMTAVKFSLVGFKFSFAFSFGDISVNTAYDMKGNLLGMVPIYGAGNVNALVKNLEISGSGAIGSQGTGEDQKLYLKDFTIKVSLDSFDLDMTGFANNEEMSSLISKMISESLPGWIETFQKQIDTVVSGKITEVADNALSGLTINDILGMLKPKPSEYMAGFINCGDF